MYKVVDKYYNSMVESVIIKYSAWELWDIKDIENTQPALFYFKLPIDFNNSL